MGTDKNRYVVFITSDQLGTGEKELGKILIKAFLNTLWEAESKPERIVFMNDGVKLSVEGSEVLETLLLLEKDGVEILTCGTCLAYYNLTEEFRIGKISNMREIVSVLLDTPRLIKI